MHRNGRAWATTAVWAAFQHGRPGASATDGLPDSAQIPRDLCAAAKQALQYRCQRVAPTEEWAGAGIILDVVAFGFYDTRGVA